MGQLRIVAGRLKGRRVRVLRRGGIRPTTDRVREALFSILGPVAEGSRVLDAYAGSGALGFEALSRGAARVVFVEADRRTVEALRAGACALGVAEDCSILEGRLTSVARSGVLGPAFSLILADPPYGDTDEIRNFLALAASLLESAGVLVLERESSAEASPGPGLTLERSARYGRSRLDFYRPTGGSAVGVASPPAEAPPGPGS